MRGHASLHTEPPHAPRGRLDLPVGITRLIQDAQREQRAFTGLSRLAQQHALGRKLHCGSYVSSNTLLQHATRFRRLRPDDIIWQPATDEPEVDPVLGLVGKLIGCRECER